MKGAKGHSTPHVQSAAGDAGDAIGSVLPSGISWLGGKRSFVMDHAYWGRRSTLKRIGKLLHTYGFDIAAAKFTFEDIRDEAALCRTAAAIAEGRVIGWFSGSDGLGTAGA